MSIDIHYDGKTKKVALEPLPSVGDSAKVVELEGRVASVEEAIGNPGASGKLDGGTF